MRPRFLLLVVALLAIGAPAASEQRAHRLDPPGMPVRLESVTFSGADARLTWVWRNATQDVLYPRLRVFVFDERRQFVGSVRDCRIEPLQPGTRARGSGAVDVDGATERHLFVAIVEAVASERTVWRVREPAVEVIAAARRMLAAQHAELSTLTRPAEQDDLSCPCECETAERLGHEGCGDALAAFSCDRSFFPDACRMGYACR